jgi:hypothetical protein
VLHCLHVRCCAAVVLNTTPVHVLIKDAARRWLTVNASKDDLLQREVSEQHADVLLTLKQMREQQADKLLTLKQMREESAKQFQQFAEALAPSARREAVEVAVKVLTWRGHGRMRRQKYFSQSPDVRRHWLKKVAKQQQELIKGTFQLDVFLQAAENCCSESNIEAHTVSKQAVLRQVKSALLMHESFGRFVVDDVEHQVAVFVLQNAKAFVYTEGSESACELEHNVNIRERHHSCNKCYLSCASVVAYVVGVFNSTSPFTLGSSLCTSKNLGLHSLLSL